MKQFHTDNARSCACGSTIATYTVDPTDVTDRLWVLVECISCRERSGFFASTTPDTAAECSAVHRDGTFVLHSVERRVA